MSRRATIRALTAAVVGTTASVLPAFMTGAVAVQLARDIGVTEGTLGLAIGAYFSSAAVGSAFLGRTAQRLGAAMAMRAGLVLTTVSGIGLALAQTPLHLGLVLLAAGVSNALTQPAANLLLADRVAVGRLGLAFAVKQAGMPTASLLGGLAVPTLALTVGWRWSYVAVALLAALAVTVIPADLPAAAAARLSTGGRARPDLPHAVLVRYGLLGLLGAAAAGAMVTFLVTAAEAAGVAPASAGLLLTGGSAVGITSRLLHGHWADGPRLLPIRRVGVLLAVGAVAAALLAVHQPWAYLVGVVPLFAFGWSWPGLFNLSVVRNNPSAAAAATGVTQTGVYIGAGAGPVVGGAIAAAAGFPGLWVACAAAMAGASATAFTLRPLLRRAGGRTTSGSRPAGR